MSHTFQYSTVYEILISSHRAFPASGTAYGEVSPSVNAQSPETVYTHISSRFRLAQGSGLGSDTLRSLAHLKATLGC